MGEYAEDAWQRKAFGWSYDRPGRVGRLGGLFGNFDRAPPKQTEYRLPQVYPTGRGNQPNVYCAKCQLHAVLRSGYEVYGRHDLRDKPVWVCLKCSDRVGCHPHTNEPLGYLANAPTRAARSLAHARFDAVWRRGCMSRTDAYRWLAGCMGLDMSVCHIGMMDVDQLNEVVNHVHSSFPELTPKLDNIANFKF